MTMYEDYHCQCCNYDIDPLAVKPFLFAGMKIVTCPRCKHYTRVTRVEGEGARLPKKKRCEFYEGNPNDTT